MLAWLLFWLLIQLLCCRYLKQVNIWKERHNEKSREVRMMLLKGMTKVEEKEERVEWDSAGSESDSEGTVPDSKTSEANNKRY